MKTYYKVVYPSYGRYYSARCSLLEDGSVPYNDRDLIEYKLNEWVYPEFKGSKLFVFDSIKNSKLFKGIWEDVYECEVGDITHPKFISGSISELKLFWLQKIKKKKVSHLKVVKPLKELY